MWPTSPFRTLLQKFYAVINVAEEDCAFSFDRGVLDPGAAAVVTAAVVTAVATAAATSTAAGALNNCSNHICYL